MNRRRVLAGLALACGRPVWAAEDYPSRPVRLIVSFGTGSLNNIVARALGRSMGEQLGQSFVVENRPGGGGVVGTEAVARAAPDGYTIGLGTSSQLVMNVGLYKTLPFDVERDLRSIGLVSRTPLVLVSRMGLPRTLPELIDMARSNPGKLTYGSGGPGSVSHIMGEAFARAAGVQLVHVPYKGNGPALNDLAGGHLDLLFDGFISSVPLAQRARAQVVAVSGQRRSAVAPEVPTFSQAGLADFQAYTWNCLFVPAQTPAPIVERLNAALNRSLASPEVLQMLAQGNSDSLGPSTPAEAEAFGHAERARWVPLVRALKIEI